MRGSAPHRVRGGAAPRRLPRRRRLRARRAAALAHLAAAGRRRERESLVTVHARPLLFFVAIANLVCANPQLTVSDALLVHAYRLYGSGDCAGLRRMIEFS